IDAADTRWVSQSQCVRTLPDPPCSDTGAVQFQGASADGARVFFTSAGQLVNEDIDSNVDLYQYDLPSGELTRISAQDGAAVRGVISISDDGRRIYFLTDETQSLYLYDNHDAELRLIAKDVGDLSPQAGLTAPSATAQSTPDGSTLVFQTSTAL